MAHHHRQRTSFETIESLKPMVRHLLICCLAFAAPPVAAQSINFGDNFSEWANDGECDDRRFVGPGMAEELDRDDTGHDASDCRKAHRQGLITLWDQTKAAAATQCSAIQFGNNRSEHARDGECDDPRFEGTGTSTVVITDDLGRDAADCRRACDLGTVFLRNY